MDQSRLTDLIPEGTRLEEQLPDRKPLMNDHEAVAEATRCLYCTDAPCIPSCPTSIDIPEFIRQISTGNTMGAAHTILRSNILGYSCSRVCPVEVLCESTCVYNELDEKPIAIGKLQRVATEQAYARNERFFEAGPDTGRKIALIGAGPASLACAHELRRLGHATVLFEKRPQPGGLNTSGVAPYKLAAIDGLREFDYVLGIGGIDIRCGVELGKDVTLAELEADYDAIFIGVGLGPDGWLKAQGADLDGVIGAIDWIERIKLDPSFALADNLQDLVVIGGGNTAIDVVREALGLDIPSVSMIYRRNEATMSGYAHEWQYAKVEGARGLWHTQPIGFEGADGVLTGVKCVRTQIDENGKVSHVEGSEHVVPAQAAVLAIGQSKLGELFGDVEGIELDWGKIATDAGGATGNPKYYAGGDCRNGGKEVVNAAAEGKAAALSIDAYLKGLGG